MGASLPNYRNYDQLGDWFASKRKAQCRINTHKEKRKLEHVRTADDESRDLWGVYEQLAHNSWNDCHPRGTESNQWHKDLRINCKLGLQVAKSTWVFASWWRFSEITWLLPCESSHKAYGVGGAMCDFLRTYKDVWSDSTRQCTLWVPCCPLLSVDRWASFLIHVYVIILMPT